MIFKKPYGFYKRNYKLIHLLLLIPMLYLFLAFGDINKFFSLFIKQNFKTTEYQLIATYIPNLMTYTLYFMIFAEGFIYWLEKSKKKPGWLYLVSLIYYILALISLIFFSGAMDSIEAETIKETMAIFIRDFAGVIKFPPIILMGWTIIKGFNFNIKTLSFERNYDIIVTDEDDELVEVKLGSDTFESKKKIVHFIREAQYYILENLFVFKALGILVLVIICFNTYMFFGVYNRQYSLNQAFNLNSITITLKDSYITNVDQAGNKIENDKYYLAVKLGLKNTQAEDVKIDRSAFRIYINGEAVYPNYGRSSRFIDIGKEYLGKELLGFRKNDDGSLRYTDDDYVLVYELDKNQVKAQYEMKILSNYSKNSNNKMVATYKTIKIKPKNIVSKEKIDTVKIGDEINLSSTTLGKTKYKLVDYQIANSFTYTYENCDNKKNCTNIQRTVGPSNGNVLVIIKDIITYDEMSSYFKYSKLDFYGDFATFKYYHEFTSKTYEVPLKKVSLSATYKDTDENGITTRVYEVNNQAYISKDRMLKLTIRNKEIDIKLD